MASNNDDPVLFDLGDDVGPDIGDAVDLGDMGGSVDLGDSADVGDPLAEPEPIPDPLAKTNYPGNLEGDALAEFLEIKKGFQEQDKNQRLQFKNIYDSEYWHADAYRTRADKERGLKIQAHILGLNYDRTGDKYRNGHEVTRAFERLAARLGIDLSQFD